MGRGEEARADRLVFLCYELLSVLGCRAAPPAYKPVWCVICCARGHDEADCTAAIPEGEEPCFFCRKIGHNYKKCPSKDANGFETWNPNAPGDENAMPTPFPRANSAARAHATECVAAGRRPSRTRLNVLAAGRRLRRTRLNVLAAGRRRRRTRLDV